MSGLHEREDRGDQCAIKVWKVRERGRRDVEQRRRQARRVALCGVAALAAVGACSIDGARGDGETQRVSAIVSSASLQLKVQTSTCVANQVQDFFQVVNTGSTAVKLSDISIKLWADDTSGQSLVPHIWTGGCASGANGSPSCSHQVTGVAATPTSFSPACGGRRDPPGQLGDHDLYQRQRDAAGGRHLEQHPVRHQPGELRELHARTGAWFSPCLPGTSYVADPHFALYYKGTLVFSNGLSAPDCRAPHGTQPITSYVQPPASPVIGPAPASQVLSVAVGLPVNNLAQLRQVADQVSDPASPTYHQYLTSAALTAAYSPSVNDYNKVVAWAQGFGFAKVGTYPNRLLVSLTGTVPQIEAAFHANVILAKRPDGSTYYRLDRQPSVDVTVPLLGVSVSTTTSRFGTATRRRRWAGSTARVTSARRTWPARRAPGSTAPVRTIGIFAFFGWLRSARHRPVPVAERHARRNGAGLNGDDPTNPSPTPLAMSGNGETGELELDLELSAAMAPAAQIVAFRETTSTESCKRWRTIRTSFSSRPHGWWGPRR